MQFTINRQAFIKALNDVSRAISSRTTIPILTNIKLVLNDEELILTDLMQIFQLKQRFHNQIQVHNSSLRNPVGLHCQQLFHKYR